MNEKDHKSWTADLVIPALRMKQNHNSIVASYQITIAEGLLLKEVHHFQTLS